MNTYHYVLASQQFLLKDEPLDEVLQERYRHYREREKEVDFWLVKQPAFLETAAFAEVKARCPQPSVAIISTDKSFITWLKLRLEYVVMGSFEAPSADIPDPIGSIEMSSP